MDKYTIHGFHGSYGDRRFFVEDGGLVLFASQLQVSHEKNPALLSIESWLFNDGILIMVYYNPYITGKYNPLCNPTNQGFFHCSSCLGVWDVDGFHDDALPLFHRWLYCLWWNTTPGTKDSECGSTVELVALHKSAMDRIYDIHNLQIVVYNLIYIYIYIIYVYHTSLHTLTFTYLICLCIPVRFSWILSISRCPIFKDIARKCVRRVSSTYMDVMPSSMAFILPQASIWLATTWRIIPFSKEFI